MSIEIVTIQDFNSFKEEVLKALKQSNTQNTQHPKWVRGSKLQEMFEISASTLQTLKASGAITHSKLNGIVYFDSESVIANLNKNMTTCKD